MALATELKDPDDILLCLGDPGKFQVIQFTLLALQFIPIAMNDLMPIFANIQPLGVYVSFNDSSSNFSMMTIAEACKSLGQTHMSEVDHTYVYPGKQRSVVGEMDLVCGKAWLANFATTMYFLAQIVGCPFFGWCADYFGRRPVLLYTNVLYTVLSTVMVFVTDYIAYVVILSLIGFVRQGMYSALIILMMEWIDPRRRGTWAAVSQFPFSFGVLLLTLAGFLLEDWRQMQIALAVANSSALGFYWFAPESLKWLIIHNYGDRAKKACVKVADFNGIVLSEEFLQKVDIMASDFQAVQEKHKVHTMLDCFKTPYMRIFMLMSCYLWLAVFMSYFSLSFLMGGIAGSIYLNVAVGGCLELIPRILCILLAQKLTSRATLSGYLITAGLLATTAGSIPVSTSLLRLAQDAVAQVGRMAIVGCFPVIAVLSSELFPTVIRNSGFGWCSIAMRLGGMVAPQFVLLGTVTPFSGLPYIVIGLACLFGVVVTVLLPETTDMKLIATIEEAEEFGTISLLVYFSNVAHLLEEPPYRHRVQS